MQFLRRAAVATALMLLAAVPTTAQNYRWDFNINGGGTWFTKMLDDEDIFDIDVNGDAFDRDIGDVKFGGNWIVGSQLGFWFSPNFGIRANGAYTSPSLSNSEDLVDDINIWNGTGDLMFRFKRPNRRWEGFEILPYIAGGLGATWVNPAGDRFVEVDNIDFITGDEDVIVVEGHSGVPIICGLLGCFGPDRPDFPGLDTLFTGERAFFLREAARFTGLVALGADFRVARAFAIRLEVGDRIWKAPIDEVAPVEDFERTVVRITEDVGNTIHQFYAIGGLNFLFGLERPKPVAVVPVPAPPPPPPPPPAPEAITVCVIDDRSEEGLQLLTAYRLRTNGDTVVVMNGDTMALANAVRPTMLATDADWYIRGAPLELGTGPQRVSYTPVGGARMIEPADLVYIGRVNGMPVYIDRASATGPLMNFGPTTDLSREISTNAEARAALQNVNVLYVPLQTVGCIFQGLQRQEEVRKK